ncbi:MAG: GYD domain-containing protein [Dehalococcoidia bacterium]
MLPYIILLKATDQGMRDIKNIAEGIEEGMRVWQAMGGKVIGFYAVMGEYDYVAIGEAPSDQAAMTFALGLSANGNVRTTTLKAFTREELIEMVKKLP